MNRVGKTIIELRIWLHDPLSRVRTIIIELRIWLTKLRAKIAWKNTSFGGSLLGSDNPTAESFSLTIKLRSLHLTGKSCDQVIP